jgi:1,2-phenylacetyl-CoA epoxidase PaaB subunit
VAGPTVQPYEVFARHARDAAASHIGLVRAASPADAGVFAYTIFDERKWAELFVVPRAALVAVVRPD